MKILFVENRFATEIWEAMAIELQRSGYEIHWLVQNPIFAPKIGVVHFIKFPNRQHKSDNSEFLWLEEFDRGVRWFGGDGTHWEYYSNEIEKIINKVQPATIFGEPTEFHELLAIYIAKKKKIPFIHPTSTRYPVGRVNFFLYDSMTAVHDSTQHISTEELNEMLDGIVNRKVKPSYMDTPKKGSFFKKFEKVNKQLKIGLGWFFGERYITPSPMKKWSLESARKKNYLRWENIALEEIPNQTDRTHLVLFPLQMQPEANIELWGHPWSDQLEIAKRISKALEKVDGRLLLKPNPKSKYELSAELCEFVENTENVIAISHKTPMKNVFSQPSLILTVTGTVLLECVFAGKPVATLGNHVMGTYPGVSKINSPEEIVEVLEKIITKDDLCASKSQKLELLNLLYQESYPGIIWDPVNQPDLMTTENVQNLQKAFKSVLNVVINNKFIK